MSKIEYRELRPLVAVTGEKRLESDYYVEGYATTYNDPYVMWEDDDGTQYREVIAAGAIDADTQMDDVIMQFDHRGRVYARTRNNTLMLFPGDAVGLLIAADLSKTEGSRSLHEDIAAGLIDRMSWAFVVDREEYDYATHTRTITHIKRIYDVSAVSMPANDNTSISARNWAEAKAAEERAAMEREAAAELAEKNRKAQAERVSALLML